MFVNCDTGERGLHEVDISLTKIVSVVNIACGGHAGDAETVEYFCKLATESGTRIVAHLSYPDKENFGRKSMDIAYSDLKESLNEQYDLIRRYTNVVKFHGALYNDACTDADLAEFLATWCKTAGISEVVTLSDGKLATECTRLHIRVTGEFFAERNYALRKDGSVGLVSRNKVYASIHSVSSAVAHTRKFIKTGKVSAITEVGDGFMYTDTPVKADSICIHSDSEIALDLARELISII